MSNSFEVIPATSSDESFTALTETAPTPVEAEYAPVEGDIEGLEARTELVREQFDSNLVEEAADADRAEERNAILLSLGWKNSLDWLANRDHLRSRLTNLGLTPAKDDHGLLGQIAKLQLGRSVQLKDGTVVWSVPNRRDERLARFYRIFYADQQKWKVEGLREAILTHKGRTGGILESAKVKKQTISKKEAAENLELAAKVEPLVKVTKEDLTSNPIKLKSPPKQGSYRLALVRITSTGLDICQIIEGEEALTGRLTDRWAAEASLSVSSEAA